MIKNNSLKISDSDKAVDEKEQPPLLTLALNANTVLINHIYNAVDDITIYLKRIYHWEEEPITEGWEFSRTTDVLEYLAVQYADLHTLKLRLFDIRSHIQKLI